MQLVLFRHGIAEDSGPDGGDASRALTREGVERTRVAARGLARMVEAPAALISSPKVRARQTAELLAVHYACQVTIEPLLADGSARDLAAMAGLYASEPRVVFVGHEPVLSELACLLCVGDAARPVLELKKAGAICLELGVGLSGGLENGRLLWLATPRMLRMLGGDGEDL